jgi:hypothetical protein
MTRPETQHPDAAPSGQGVSAHFSATLSSPFGNSYGAMGNTQQYSLVDPNVMMMTNAAATIAAVAASAVQQMAQGNGLLSGGAGTTTSMPPALVAAVRSTGNQPVPLHPQSNTSMSPHVAAFFGAAGGGQHSIQFQNLSSVGSMPSQLRQALNQGEAASALHPSATAAAQAAAPMSSGAISKALLPSMQKWKYDQLGKYDE